MFSLKAKDPVVIINEMNTGLAARDTDAQDFEVEVLKDADGELGNFLKQDIIPPHTSSLRTEVRGQLADISFDHADSWRVAEFKFSTGEIFYSKVKNGVRLTRFMNGRVVREVLSNAPLGPQAV